MKVFLCKSVLEPLLQFDYRVVAASASGYDITVFSYHEFPGDLVDYKYERPDFREHSLRCLVFYFVDAAVIYNA